MKLHFNYFRMASSLGVALAGVAISQADTIYSDDFSSSLAGGAASSSDYTLFALGGFTGPNDYRVISDPSTAWTNGYPGLHDHTTGLATGAMLFFDGSASTSSRIYYHSIPVTAGVTYTVSYWGAAASGDNLATLNLSVDGSAIGSALTTVLDQWQMSSTTYTPTSSGTATFAITDSVTAGFGNDGAVDDFLVTAPVPEPSSLAALGLFTLPLLLRRRK